MPYVDGFLVPIRKKNVVAYRRLAQKSARIWKKYGALEFRECIGDDLKPRGAKHFGALVRLKPGETVFFSWITYKSRAHRDRVNAKIMKDPEIAKMMTDRDAPFDSKRMVYGGFKVLVGM